jgi:thiamine biosynthesis lipoprotein
MARAAYNRVLKLMGNRFEFTVIADNKTAGEKAIDAAVMEVKRIEDLLSTFKDSSQTSLINQHAGIKAVKVDQEVIALIQRAVKISDITQGAFDISYGAIDKSLWNFDVNMTSLPDFETARQSVSLINYRNIIIDPEKSTIMLKHQGMRIGFGGIGKGYAADSAKRVLQNIGIDHGIVNAAGDLVTWGNESTGKPWTIGIADPGQSDRPFSALNISNMAIATSGNYEKYVTINGRRYSHTIDPKTGLPVSGIKSVSIICPSAELADALATPVIIMGAQVGLDMINQLRQVACIIIDDNDRLYTSNNINVKQ